jgi:cell division septation protein DedD
MGRKEVFFIFFLFLIGAAVIFAMGVKVGEYLFENECQTILEESLKKAKVADERPQEPEQTVAQVQVQPETPEQGIKNEEQTASSLGIKEITDEIKGKYTIQISSYQDELEAQQVSYQLYSSGFKLAYYMEAEIPNKGIWYRVGIGFFKKRESARIFAEMLKKQGKIESYIIRKID